MAKSLVDRGMGPSTLFAYIVYINERLARPASFWACSHGFFAASIAIELAVITFAVF